MARLRSTATPKLSVVVPAYNEALFIVRTLARCAELASSPETLEIVVADGGSADGTVEAVLEYAALQQQLPATATVRVVRSRGFGRGASLDAGIAASASSRLLFLHADATPPRGFDRLAVDAIDDPSLMLGAFSFGVDRSTLQKPHPRGLAIMEAGANIRSRRLSLPYGDQALFATRSTIEELGGFGGGSTASGDAMPMMEDIALVRRASRLGRATGRRMRILDETVLCDGRRWEKLGVLRTTLTNQLLVALYDLGVQPATIFRWYYGFAAPTFTPTPAPPPPAKANAANTCGTLLLVAKWPMEGTSKTRLATAVGDARAVDLAKAMLADLLCADFSRREEAALRCVLYFAPPEREGEVAKFLEECGDDVAQRWELLPMPMPSKNASSLKQSSLTTVLSHAHEWTKRNAWSGGGGDDDVNDDNSDAALSAAPIVFIGSDCPNVPYAALDAALAQSDAHNALICPSTDGGYTLLGVGAHAVSTIFDGVAWSSEQTCESQVAALTRSGVATRIWPDTTRDVDELDDAVALLDCSENDTDSGSCGGGSSSMPRTLAVLRGWQREGVM